MKKKLALLLAMMVVTGALAACGGGNADTGSSGATTGSTDAATATTTTDTAADTATTADDAGTADTAAATPAGNVLEDAAMEYFNTFPKQAAFNNNAISTADLMALMDAEEDMMILDIRQADAYAEGHLKGAINVPYQDVPNYLEQIPDDIPVFVNCYTGQTSSQTVALLCMAGKYAVNIQSGWNRGISTTEGYEAYTETEANEMPEGSYPVDADIAAAIKNYYEEAYGASYQYFNFKLEDLQELVDAESDQYTILSVRQAKDYAEEHIPGAINIPFGQGMQNSFSEIPTDKPVVVYCYTGQTASQVMAVLRMLGYEAYNLNGGMGNENFGWKSINGTLTNE